MPGTVIQIANGGRGFVIEAEVDRYVITAAHCLNKLPEPFGAAGGYPDERTYEDFLGPLGTSPHVWAECVFVDPVADLAVFYEPDSQALGDRARAYRELTDSATTFALGKLPPYTTSDAMMLSLDDEWFACRVTRVRHSLWIENAAQSILPGMSGSPIILPDGSAVGVVCVGDGVQVGPNPMLSAFLPAWLVHDAY
jgi:Trypsin-like peptidase domain